MSKELCGGGWDVEAELLPWEAGIRWDEVEEGEETQALKEWPGSGGMEFYPKGQVTEDKHTGWKDNSGHEMG